MVALDVGEGHIQRTQVRKLPQEGADISPITWTFEVLLHRLQAQMKQTGPMYICQYLRQNIAQVQAVATHSQSIE